MGGRAESSRSVALRRAILFPVAVMVTYGLLVGCSSMPPSPYGAEAEPLDLAPGLVDDRGRFREIFCTVLAQDPDALPDARPCDEAITVVGPVPSGTGQVVDLGGSDRHLVAAIGDRNLLFHTIERTTHSEPESPMRTAV